MITSQFCTARQAMNAYVNGCSVARKESILTLTFQSMIIISLIQLNHFFLTRIYDGWTLHSSSVMWITILADCLFFVHINEIWLLHYLSIEL